MHPLPIQETPVLTMTDRPADAQRYAGGGLRITPGQPFRPAGELDQPQYDIRPMLTSAKEAI